MIMRPSVNRLPTAKLKLRFIGLRESNDSRPPKMSQCLKWRGGDDEQVSENSFAFSFQFSPVLPPCLRRNQFDIDDTGTVWDSSEAMVSPNFNPYSLNNATHTTFCSCYRFHFNLVEKPGRRCLARMAGAQSQWLGLLF